MPSNGERNRHHEASESGASNRYYRISKLVERIVQKVPLPHTILWFDESRRQHESTPKQTWQLKMYRLISEHYEVPEDCHFIEEQLEKLLGLIDAGEQYLNVGKNPKFTPIGPGRNGVTVYMAEHECPAFIHPFDDLGAELKKMQEHRKDAVSVHQPSNTQQLSLRKKAIYYRPS